MKYIPIIIALLLAHTCLHAQTLSLQQCLDAVETHYPLAKQKSLDTRVSALREANIRATRAPQVALNAQASYQSEVTTLGIELPGVNIEPLSKDQYRITADVNYTLFDGGISKAQKALEQVSLKSKHAQVDAEIIKVQEQVMGAYFKALLFEKNKAILEGQKKVLDARLNKVKAMVEYGTAMRNQADIIRMELLMLEQREEEASAGREQSLSTIRELTGIDISTSTKLVEASMTGLKEADFTARPEYALLDQQAAGIELQNSVQTGLARPKASLFGQGGYGRPGLNFLENSFSPWYIGGIRLSWNLSPLYSLKRNKQINSLSKEIVDLQKSVIDTRLQNMYNQQKTESTKLEKLVERDKTIIEYTESISKSYAAQLDNGVITSDTYVAQLNNETQARLSLALHETQLLMALHTINILTGNTK